jgi:hypothetical protein
MNNYKYSNHSNQYVTNIYTNYNLRVTYLEHYPQ